MALHLIGYCLKCRCDNRHLTLSDGVYECQTCKDTWTTPAQPPRILYVALISHDDESHAILPLRICETAEIAKHACTLAAIENGDTVPLIWNEGEGPDSTKHSRIEGEFWTAPTENPDGQTFTYYVRPATLQ
jgi:hypothetical protein